MAPLALFDLTGTLTDPVPGLLASHRFAFADLDLDFDAFANARSEMSVEELARLRPLALYPQLGLSEDQAASVLEVFKQRHAVTGWMSDALLPGIDDLLVALLENGWKLAVATRQLEGIAERVIDRLGMSDRFEFVAGSNAPRARQPLGMGVSGHLSERNIEPDGMAVIGDRADVVELATALGATSIGAAWGFGSIEELMAAGVDAVAVTPAEVVDLLVE